MKLLFDADWLKRKIEAAPDVDCEAGRPLIMSEIQGTRVMPDANGWLGRDIDKPGHYGRATNERVLGTRTGWWEVTCPDGSVGSLNPEVHTVVEHEDGTITVTPSLDMSKRKAGGWHGYLTRGVFRSV